MPRKMKPKMEVEEPQQPQEMDEGEEDAESSSEEDENGELINDHFEGKFLSVLAKLRTKAPEVIGGKDNFFTEDDFQNSQKQQPQQEKKKLTIKDLERQKILEKMDKKNKKKGKDEEEDAEEVAFEDKPYFYQQEDLKNAFKQAIAGGEHEGEDDDLFKVKKKVPTAQEMETEEQKLERLAPTKKDAEVLKKFWGNDKNLDETDMFLKKYILDKGWIDKGDSKTLKLKKKLEKIDKIEEEQLEAQEEFETRYNFRFEEPDGAHIQTYPRKIAESMRQKEETRKEKRKRKEQEKKEKLEQERKEAEKLKQQKKKELKNKLQEIAEEQGLDNIEIEDENNPEEDDEAPITWIYCDDCEKGLKEQEQFYECQTCDNYILCGECFELVIHPHEMQPKVVEEGNGSPDEEEVRRVLASLLKCKKCKTMIDEFAKRYEVTDNSSGLTYNYCADCHDSLPLTLKKRAKEIAESKVKLDEILQKDPEKLKEFVQDSDVDRLLQEYMGLDYNEKIGELKTKFKYMQVKPESYGLSDEQLLFSDDKELNKYVSIKKIAPYRDETVKLRSNIYNQKIKTIDRSANFNKREVLEEEEQQTQKIKNKKKIEKLKERMEKKKQRAIKGVERLRLLNLSRKEDEVKHFIAKSRLESYK